MCVCTRHTHVPMYINTKDSLFLYNVYVPIPTRKVYRNARCHHRILFEAIHFTAFKFSDGPQ